jgi:cobalt-zinc-cadmium efflux system membrane fusion protein
MTEIPKRSQSPTAIRYVSGAFLSLFLLATPATVLAHGGHGDEFQGGTAATQAAGNIQVDAQTAKRLGIKVEGVARQRLAVGIKTTGQIETLPNKKVEVTTPISGAKVAELLVEPGASVQAGQPVAVLAAPDLVELRVSSEEKRAEAIADLQQAQADLKLAQQNLERQQQIAAAEIAQARTEVKVAQEQYDRDRDLVNAGALPRREMLESQAHLSEGKAQLTKAASRREVLEAEAQLKRAQSAVEVAQSRLRLSNATYQTRLQQLGAQANAKGLVTVTTPISGRVADREATLGQSFEDAGGKLMTIVNDSQVFATANIYEKDLDKVKTGQGVNVKVAPLPNRTFTGQIAVIGSVVEGETRVVPVKAQLDNSSGVLKPGMFAELEVLTDQTAAAMTAIPTSAIVEANGKQLVYVQNGNAYQPVEVTLGQTSGNLVEVKTGLFDGDRVVTQGAMQLYAQSLRGGSNAQANEEHDEAPAPSPAADANRSGSGLPWWWVIPAGGVLTAAAFWAGRRTQRRLTPAYEGAVENHLSNGSARTEVFDRGINIENERYQNNHHQPKPQVGKLESSNRNHSEF